MVQRADLLRFRIITVRVDPPAQAATVAGRIELIGLQEVRQTLGVHWEAMKDRCMAAAEQVIRSRIGPHDTLSRIEDGGFTICFASLSEEAAAAQAASIGREVRRRLIGDGETPEAAHVFSAATALPSGASALSASELAATVRRGVDAKLRTMMEGARTQLAAALANTGFETDAVHARERADAVGRVVRLPASVKQALDGATAVLPAAETVGVSKDAMLLGVARSCVAERALHNARQPVFVMLSMDVLLDRRCMDACAAACGAIEERLRQQLVLIVPAPPTLAASRLSDGLKRLHPFCRSLGVAVESLDVFGLDVRDLGLAVLAVDAAACESQPGWENKVRLRASSLRAQRCRLMVRGVGPWNSAKLLSLGVDLVAMGG